MKQKIIVSTYLTNERIARLWAGKLWQLAIEAKW